MRIVLTVLSCIALLGALALAFAHAFDAEEHMHDERTRAHLAESGSGSE